MSSDTMRPHLDAELAAEIDDAIREHVRIPPDCLAVGDRIRVLLEEYHDATERVESLESELERREQQIDELEEALAEARNQGGVLSS
jgi:chromosome segregation ATPase